MKRYIVLFMATAFLGVSCKDKYQEGFNAGQTQGLSDGRRDGLTQGYNAGFTAGANGSYQTGYNDGRAAGQTEGFNDGRAYYTSHNTYGHGYDDGFVIGFNDGKLDGGDDGYEDAYNAHFDIGRANGYNVGLADGLSDGYNSGFNRGDIDGFNDGVEDGAAATYQNGYNAGYAAGDYQGFNDGYEDGRYDGNQVGYDAGYADGSDDGDAAGYSDGYDDGWTDGVYAGTYGLSSASKSSNPSVKLAALVNSDLINYSSLKKFDSQAARSSLGLSHADASTVDMEKLATIKEQYFLNQMGQQIQARFGLSSERSKEIAVVAHQFNKLAGTRELTDKDADAFAVSIIGHNLKDIESAVKKSAKGESELLNKMLSDIADHNKTSPENVNSIISTIFF